MLESHWEKEHSDLAESKFGFVKAGKRPRTRAGAAVFNRVVKLLEEGEKLENPQFNLAPVHRSKATPKQQVESLTQK